MAAGNASAVRALFGRCLLTCLSVGLWGTYLRFIQQVLCCWLRICLHACRKNTTGASALCAGWGSKWRARDADCLLFS